MPHLERGGALSYLRKKTYFLISAGAHIGAWRVNLSKAPCSHRVKPL